MAGHTQARCYKLHGYLVGHNFHKPANGVFTNQVSSQNIKDDFEDKVSLTKG